MKKKHQLNNKFTLKIFDLNYIYSVFITNHFSWIFIDIMNLTCSQLKTKIFENLFL